MNEIDFTLANSLIGEYLSIKNSLIQSTIDCVDDLLTAFIEEINVIKSENKKNSFLFNPLRFFDISETKHSFLLRKLLDPHSEHGQGDLFLKIFLKQIGIVVGDSDRWIVTAENERIDVLIKRKYPPSVIVIENKSNYALDQENQLYRYWLDQMFFPNELMPVHYTLENRQHFRLIYLSPTKAKRIGASSLTKPRGLDAFPDLPEMLNIDHITELTFDEDIVKWLKGCTMHLNENHRLREYINQYIELWNFK